MITSVGLTVLCRRC